MAFTPTNLAAEPRAISLGPIKMQILTYTAVSGDTSGTVTVSGFTDRIDSMVIDGGLKLTAAITFAGNVATLAFTDPAANAFGTIIAHGI